MCNLYHVINVASYCEKWCKIEEEREQNNRCEIDSTSKTVKPKVYKLKIGKKIKTKKEGKWWENVR